MPLITYTEKKFNADHTEIITRANTVITEYAVQGYDLTLRQLYYQFVSRNWLVNNDRNYKKLGNVISDARRAGMIDWERIVDRTRFVRNPSSWGSPSQIVSACASQYDVDWWATQKYRPEVWIEKDALVGVLEVACAAWHCPYFSCRGYSSDSETWAGAQRMLNHRKKGQIPIVFHLGDHDPSGIDMSRDITDRLKLFANGKVEVRRLALTMTQVDAFNPPPNPAKQTDCRFAAYQELYGDESWELDALNPTTITEIIATEMASIIDQSAWSEMQEQRDEGRRLLAQVADSWENITDGM